MDVRNLPRRGLAAPGHSGIVFALTLLVLAACARRDAPLSRAEAAIEAVRANHAPDPRVARFEVTAAVRGGVIILTGETDRAAAREALLSSLRGQGVEVQDEITLLPHSSLKGRHHALVDVSVASLRAEPRHSGELTTQATLGTRLRVLKRDGGFFLVQTPDDYLGWIARGSIALLAREELEELAARKLLIYLETTGRVYEAPDREARPVSDIVIGSRLLLEESGDEFHRVRFPGGRTGYVASDEAALYTAWLAGLRHDGSALVLTARQFRGIPYLWGGTSSKGFDCSGLVKTVYFLNGLILPRDASQQVRCGELIDERGEFDRLEPGDLLFFGERETASTRERIRHVGMWIGGGQYIHAFAGRVRIASVRADDPSYDERNRKRYLRAKRILGSEGQGVKRLTEKPWR